MRNTKKTAKRVFSLALALALTLSVTAAAKYYPGEGWGPGEGEFGRRTWDNWFYKYNEDASSGFLDANGWLTAEGVAGQVEIAQSNGFNAITMRNATGVKKEALLKIDKLDPNMLLVAVNTNDGVPETVLVLDPDQSATKDLKTTVRVVEGEKGLPGQDPNKAAYVFDFYQQGTFGQNVLMIAAVPGATTGVVSHFQSYGREESTNVPLIEGTLAVAKDGYVATTVGDSKKNAMTFTNPNRYFNEAEYLSAKLQALKSNAATKTDWSSKSVTELKAALALAGGADAAAGGIDVDTFATAKVNQLVQQGGEQWATSDIYALVALAGITQRYETLEAFGTEAGGTLLNSSNAFDANTYFAAKLAQLQKGDPAGKTDLAEGEVVPDDYVKQQVDQAFRAHLQEGNVTSTTADAAWKKLAADALSPENIDKTIQGLEQLAEAGNKLSSELAKDLQAIVKQPTLEDYVTAADRLSAKDAVSGVKAAAAARDTTWSAIRAGLNELP